ncbi:MAG: nucleotide pyrophosphohydrolase, partial [Candidatus Enteromonas sp.]
METNIMNDIRHFVHERNWEQYHTGENLAKSVAIEAGELLE